MPYAVLHATTRVIRRLTVDAMHQIAADEILESVIPPITLAGGPWVLVAENGIVRAATPAGDRRRGRRQHRRAGPARGDPRRVSRRE